MTEPLNNHSTESAIPKAVQPALKSHEEVGALIGNERLEALVKQLTLRTSRYISSTDLPARRMD